MNKKEKKCRCKKCISFRKEHDIEWLDIYGLYYHLSKHIYPRLKLFRDNTFSYPMGLTLKKWKIILNKMIFAFKAIAKDDRKEEEYKKIEEGLKLFAKYFTDLWV
jgi:hypothetical protein